MCQTITTILLADDDPDDRELLKEAIRGIAPAILVLVFENGREILNYLAQEDRNTPSLIVLDYNMPIAGGLDVLRKIFDDPVLKLLPAIIWSTANSVVYEADCLNYGALKYIVKPSELSAYKKLANDIIAICGNT